MLEDHQIKPPVKFRKMKIPQNTKLWMSPKRLEDYAVEFVFELKMATRRRELLSKKQIQVSTINSASASRRKFRIGK